MLKIKRIAATLLLVGLTACSLWPGRDNDREKRGQDDEKITILKVYISAEREQCEDESGKKLPVTKETLQNAGIKVYSSECGAITGLMAPALCGKATLDINIHGIDDRKISEAEAIGYKSVESFEDGLGYATTSCE